MGQLKVWEKIAAEWNTYRTHPRAETLEFLQNKKGLVLDLGCANGRNFVKIDGRIIGVDFSYNMLRYARNKTKEDGLDIDLARADAVALPFSDSSFDSVIFANALPSIKYNKHKSVLKEIARVCKNKADIFISVWNKDQPRFSNREKESTIAWKSEERYYYLYSKDELKALMKKYFAGVRVFGSYEKAFKTFPKDIIAVAKVRK